MLVNIDFATATMAELRAWCKRKGVALYVWADRTDPLQWAAGVDMDDAETTAHSFKRINSARMACAAAAVRLRGGVMADHDCDVVCPFCGEGDFDLIGLKIHLWSGHCEVLNATPMHD
jgi:hypothetical protein